MTTPAPTTPTFEHYRPADTLGIGHTRPRLSWLLPDTVTAQHGYDIEIHDPRSGTRTAAYVASPEHVLVPWPAEPLTSRQQRDVRVRLHATMRDGTDTVTDWSPWARAETGLLNPAEWKAKFISPAEAVTDIRSPKPVYLLRGDFDTLESADILEARLYASAHGVYEFEINGARVGDHVLSPGWTSYQDRIRYQTYDVTDLLRSGTNRWGARVGDGWFRGRLGFNGGISDIYGTRTALIGQLHVRYANGTEHVYTTGSAWRSRVSEITASGLLDGETIDARALDHSWSFPGPHFPDWDVVEITPDTSTAVLVAPDGPPVRRIETLPVLTFTRVDEDTVLLDFGQNLVGVLRLTVAGPVGTTITIRHAEILQEGRLCTAPLRHAAATDTITLAGVGVETFEPRFTTHGFRYAEISGWPGPFDPASVEAVVTHSDMAPTSTFVSSHAGLNRLEQNVRWGMRGNFIDVPTDCPQRDERLGYSGDLHVFAPTAATLYDCHGFVTSWLTDLLLDQTREGSGVPPVFSPDIPVNMPFPVPPGNLPAAGWSDAIIGVPWAMYLHYGDTLILDLAWEGMTRWAGVVEHLVGPEHIWDKGFQFGDWLDPAAPPDNPSASTTDNALVATAYYARSIRTLSRVATALGKTSDADRYADLSDRIAAAFRNRFVLGPGRMTSDTQAAYALAIRFALLETKDDALAAGSRLAQLLQQAGHTIGTGFLATPHVCDALADTGHLDDAYALLLQRQSPSWLYQVDMGATTIWERWDSLLPSGQLNPGEMTSFNHYAFGSIADFIHRRIGGIEAAKPGHRTIRIAPRPGGGITSADTTHNTPYGTIRVRWQKAHARSSYIVQLPSDVTASVDLAGHQPFTVTGGTHHITIEDA